MILWCEFVMCVDDDDVGDVFGCFVVLLLMVFDVLVCVFVLMMCGCKG